MFAGQAVAIIVAASKKCHRDTKDTEINPQLLPAFANSNISVAPNKKPGHKTGN
jgi:hypothetical protein